MPRRQPCLYCEKTQLAKFGSPTLHLGRSRNAALRSGGWGNEPYVKKKKKKSVCFPQKVDVQEIFVVPIIGMHVMYTRGEKKSP